MNQTLFDLYQEGTISLESAIAKSTDLSELKNMLQSKLGIVFNDEK